MAPVLCRCSTCSKKQCKYNDQLVSGCLISRQTRLKHEKQAQAAHASSSESDDAPMPSASVQPSSSNPDPINLNEVLAPVFQLCNILVAWLSLAQGVSRKTANVVLKVLRLIQITTLRLVLAAFLSAGVPASISTSLDIPQDIRTVYLNGELEPEIIRIISCPKCFKPYLLVNGVAPAVCSYKRSVRAKACGTALWKQRHTRTGTKRVPALLYSTQSFESWLCFMLSRAPIEDCLRDSFAKYQNRPPLHQMHDVHDSPAWYSLRGFLRSPYHLVFALYIDWFNPFSNKIAGKKVSCGAIILYCLNLPLEIRFLPENTFIVGMIPGPHEPDVWTISHILESLKNAIIAFDLPGKVLPTYYFPNGVDVASRIIPLIADLLASRKTAGYLSHSANAFCSFCELLISDIENLNYTEWVARTGANVRMQAEEWKNCPTISGKKEIAKRNGVRWTPLHDLEYWNPVQYVILGFMHNSLEGVLEHQLRILWGIGRTKAAIQKLEEDADDETYSESEISESSDELDDLRQETIDYQTLNLTEDLDLMEVDEEESEDTPTPTPAPYMDDSDSDSDTEYIPANIQGAFDFTSEQLEQIQTCIQNILLPTWVERPPGNLGEAQHGKLKAHELLILFTDIFPLIIPELWWNEDNTDKKMLTCFCNLIASTNIIASYSMSNAKADSYMHYFVEYRSLIQELHPQFQSLPNHHYAMHNGDILKFWGPLAVLSEFPGERMNGAFGKIKTNSKRGDMELTMLRQSIRRGRLDALLGDRSFTDPVLEEMTLLLKPENVYAFKTPPQVLSEVEMAKLRKKGAIIEMGHYSFLLQYLRSMGNEYQSAYSTVPHPRGTAILPTTAEQPSQFKFQGKTYSKEISHEGNSHIQFYIPGTTNPETGVIEHIWELPLQGLLHTFLFVRQHKALPASLESKTPYYFAPCSLLMSKIVDAAPSSSIFILEPHHIITHLTVYKRPKGTYKGVARDTLAICWALNRGRR
ncbi:hypothetical protein BDZ89DRAFT_1216320 [Hymenopellis radicata]|nr:hypothetical protein BDZ89DRAFT_1216320 [Hymenopellis radicata]